MLVRESISFQRGMDSKKVLDVGNLRKENIKKFIQEGLFEIVEPYLSPFDRQRKGGIHFSPKYWFDNYDYKNSKPGIRIWVEMKGLSQIILFKKKVIKWIQENTNFKVVKTLKSRDGFSIEFLLKEKSKVNEGLNFKRGIDPKESLDIGLYRKIHPPYDDIPDGAYIAISDIDYPYSSTKYQCIILRDQENFIYIKGWEDTKRVRLGDLSNPFIKRGALISFATYVSTTKEEFDIFADSNKVNTLIYLGPYEESNYNSEKIKSLLNDNR